MSNCDPYSDSPGPWLVGTTKVYSGVGADIVMESITPLGFHSRIGRINLSVARYQRRRVTQVAKALKVAGLTQTE